MGNGIKIGVIIPDRNDRPEFLNHCLEMINGQTLQPDFIELVNYEHISTIPDLTPRIRKGFDSLKNKCDVVLIMENDDYYAPDYIETMIKLWIENGKPEIFGTHYTIYYHIGKREFRILEHDGRASLMNTLIRTDAKISYPEDHEVYLDIHLWKHLKGISVDPCKVISIGIKHGVGLCGGNGHNGMKFNIIDYRLNFLSAHVQEKQLSFYETFYND